MVVMSAKILEEHLQVSDMEIKHVTDIRNMLYESVPMTMFT